MKKSGKPIGSDLKERKKILVILKTFEKANKKDSSVVREKLGDKNLSLDDITKIKKIIIETGAYQDCFDYALKLNEEARVGL